MAALLRELAALNPGLCICTSRLPLADLEDFGNASVLAIDLDNLTPESGGLYLGHLGVQGSEEELQQASKDFDNHALALTLLGNYLVKRRGGDVRKRDTIPSLFDEPKKGGQARRILRQYEELFQGKPELEVLRILGLFDRPADGGAVKILRTMGEDQWAGALENLAETRLIQHTDPDGPLDCHPLVREHFAEEFRTSKPEAFRAAHARLYEHYSKQAPHRPDTLEQMAPLFYAVYHGCQAGRHQEACEGVYFDRILGSDEYFLTRKFGAFGVDLSLLSNFFVKPWTTPVPGLAPAYQSCVSGEAAYSLRALGRLRDAIEPMQAGVGEFAQLSHWKNAAINLSNLSELHLALGNIREAIDAAQQSVKIADRSEDEGQRILRRTTLGDALHQSGDLNGAAQLFEEAERMQAAWQPEYPLLYSLRGYQYCDLLLAQGRSNEILQRAAKTLEAGKPFYSLLEPALDHLSLGHAHLAGSAKAAQHINQAVNGLRRAGQLHYLPCGLLARAAHFRHTGDSEKAQHDLDEVRIHATRCGMRLTSPITTWSKPGSSWRNKSLRTPVRILNLQSHSWKRLAIIAATPTSPSSKRSSASSKCRPDYAPIFAARSSMSSDTTSKSPCFAVSPLREGPYSSAR